MFGMGPFYAEAHAVHVSNRREPGASSTKALLERIDLALVQELLRAVTGIGSELKAVSFEN
jgi:hypothetical protein